jgi:hypothetical protein
MRRISEEYRDAVDEILEAAHWASTPEEKSRLIAKAEDLLRAAARPPDVPNGQEFSAFS